MDFSISKQEEAFRHELRTWLENNLPAGWLQGDRELPKEKQAYASFLRNWQRTLYDGGWGRFHGRNHMADVMPL